MDRKDSISFPESWIYDHWAYQTSRCPGVSRLHLPPQPNWPEFPHLHPPAQRENHSGFLLQTVAPSTVAPPLMHYEPTWGQDGTEAGSTYILESAFFQGQVRYKLDVD